MRHLILSSYDRGTIETLFGFGYSMQKIADTLRFSKPTIHYERQRLKLYHAQIAQKDADKKGLNCGRKKMLS